jgi:glycerol kinase
MMAGLGAGIWRNVDELKQVRETDRRFTATTTAKDRRDRLKTWRKAIKRARHWID